MTGDRSLPPPRRGAVILRGHPSNQPDATAAALCLSLAPTLAASSRSVAAAIAFIRFRRPLRPPRFPPAASSGAACSSVSMADSRANSCGIRAPRHAKSSQAKPGSSQPKAKAKSSQPKSSQAKPTLSQPTPRQVA